MPHCGPYRIIELSYQTRMAKLEVKGGKDKCIHLRWLSLCDLKTLKRFQKKPWMGNYKCLDDLEPILETDESLMTEDQSRIRREKEGDEQQNERIDGGPHHEIDKFLDEQSRDTVVLDDDAPQDDGMDVNVPEVLNEAEKQTERTKVFQEQRGRKPEKRWPARADSGKISSHTCSQSQRSCSPLLSLLHSNTDSHFPLGSSVAPYPSFTIRAVAKPGLMNIVKNGICSRTNAIVCFSSLVAQVISDQKSTTPKSSKVKKQADQRAEAKRKEAAEKQAKEKAQTEEVKRQ